MSDIEPQSSSIHGQDNGLQQPSLTQEESTSAQREGPTDVAIRNNLLPDRTRVVNVVNIIQILIFLHLKFTVIVDTLFLAKRACGFW